MYKVFIKWKCGDVTHVECESLKDAYVIEDIYKQKMKDTAKETTVLKVDIKRD